MPEQKQGYMAELDQWTQETILDPLHEAVVSGDSADCDAMCEEVKRAIREKVLESYRNGQQARERKPAASRAYENRRPQYKRDQ